MTGRIPSLSILLGVLVIGLGCVACAERAPARSFAALQHRLQAGATVYVIDRTGTETRGTVVAITPSQLSLASGGVERHLPEDEVRQVQQYGDRLWNGMLIGMAAAIPGVLIGDPTYRPCPANPARQCANSQIGQRVIAIGVMGAIGAGVDALIRGRHQVYLASVQGVAARPPQSGRAPRGDMQSSRTMPLLVRHNP